MAIYPYNHKNLGNTPNNSGKFKTGEPRFLVEHYTAAGGGAGSASFLFHPHSPGSSAHFVVDRNGDVYQLADTEMVTWHAGDSFWRGIRYLNPHAIGIEIANYGYWRPGVPKFAESIKAHHKNGGPELEWEVYPEEQIQSALTLSEWCIKMHPTIKEIVGHDDIAPKRKLDPGPAFPMYRFQLILHPDSADSNNPTPSAFITNIADLNLRGGPGTTFKVLASLAKGVPVTRLRDEGDWSFVEVMVPGWQGPKQGYVFDRYLTPT